MGNVMNKTDIVSQVDEYVEKPFGPRKGIGNRAELLISPSGGSIMDWVLRAFESSESISLEKLKQKYNSMLDDMFKLNQPLYDEMFNLNSVILGKFANFYNSLAPTGSVIITNKPSKLVSSNRGIHHEDYGPSIYWFIFACGHNIQKAEMQVFEPGYSNQKFLEGSKTNIIYLNLPSRSNDLRVLLSAPHFKKMQIIISDLFVNRQFQKGEKLFCDELFGYWLGKLYTRIVQLESEKSSNNYFYSCPLSRHLPNIKQRDMFYTQWLKEIHQRRVMFENGRSNVDKYDNQSTRECDDDDEDDDDENDETQSDTASYIDDMDSNIA